MLVRVEGGVCEFPVAAAGGGGALGGTLHVPRVAFACPQTTDARNY